MGGGDWLGLWSQMDYSSVWNDSSLCSFSRWRLKQINNDAQTVSLSSLFHMLITRSLKKCCLKSVLTWFLYSFNEWPLVQLQDENSKKVSNLTEDKPYTILKTSIRSALTRLSSNDHKPNFSTWLHKEGCGLMVSSLWTSSVFFQLTLCPWNNVETMLKYCIPDEVWLKTCIDEVGYLYVCIQLFC